MQKIYAAYGDTSGFEVEEDIPPYELKEGEDIEMAIRSFAKQIQEYEKEAREDEISNDDYDDVLRDIDYTTVELLKTNHRGDLFVLSKDIKLYSVYKFYIWDAESGEPELKVDFDE